MGPRWMALAFSFGSGGCLCFQGIDVSVELGLQLIGKTVEISEPRLRDDFPSECPSQPESCLLQRTPSVIVDCDFLWRMKPPVPFGDVCAYRVCCTDQFPLHC